MKPDKHLFLAAGIIVSVGLMIAMTWIGTNRAIEAAQFETNERVAATLSNQALTFTEQINRQILAIDQTLKILVNAWQANFRGFDLEAWRNQSAVLNGISRDMVLTDENGIIRQSSVSDAVSQNASGLDYFRVLAEQSDAPDKLYIGPATIDGIMRQWHMNVARPLHYPDGSFAGVIDADYRISALTEVFSQTDLRPGKFLTLVSLDDAKLRGAVGPSSLDPDSSIGDTEMFAAIRDEETGLWTGPSANDAVRRIHAFRRLPGRNLVVVVAMDEAEAMHPATVARDDARLFGGMISVLLVFLAGLLVHGIRLARQRELTMAEDRATLAASNAQLEVARALAAAKAEQLEVTLAGITDGVSMVDAHMCLMEWNTRFPEIAGVPQEILRVGLPMEEILRALIRAGQFGTILDEETEIERRMNQMRTAPFGNTQRQRPDGHTIELHRNRLPDGGFVTLYSDITERRQTEEALRNARAVAERASAEKGRFVAIVSHEIRTPLNALLNTLNLLNDSQLGPAQQSLLGLAIQSGDALSGLINDILDMSSLEAGKLSIRTTRFELRPVLEGCAEMFAVQAAARGMTLRVAIAEGTPTTLMTDPSRLRQIHLNLLSNAVKYANPGEVWLTAEPGTRNGDALRITVQDDGPVISPEQRQRLFRPFSRLDRPEDAKATGTGLGLSICHHLITLMGGQIGAEVWENEHGARGNVFWLTLPHSAVPADAVIAGAPDAADAPGTEPKPAKSAIAAIPAHRPPRTRILLVEDVVANQLVTTTMLRREGHYVDIADNGAAAVEAVKAAPYDLVFMDHFMPGMTGPEATRIIRGLPAPASALPIIALTANSSPEDEAMFESAGMNGILTKPVSLADLQDALQQVVWLPQVPDMAAVAAVSAEAPDTATALPKAHIPVLATDRIEELRANLPPDTVVTLMEECLSDLDHRMPALRRALATGAPAAVNIHAHAMAGVAASYGMASLEARLRAVMMAAREDNLASLGPDTAFELDQELADAASQLRTIMRREPA